MGFGKEIKRLRQEALISVQRIADLVGIDAARWRKWEQMDYEPRKDDIERLEAFFGMDIEMLGQQKSIRDFLKHPKTSKPDLVHNSGQSEGADYKELYIIELKEKTSLLKNQVDFLQRLVESSLVSIGEQQLTLLAEVQAIQQWDAQVASDGDKEVEIGLLKHIHKLTADNRQRLSKKDKIVAANK